MKTKMILKDKYKSKEIIFEGYVEESEIKKMADRLIKIDHFLMPLELKVYRQIIDDRKFMFAGAFIKEKLIWQIKKYKVKNNF